MKKFLLIAAIGVAGLVSAKSSDIIEKEEVNIKTEIQNQFLMKNNFVEPKIYTPEINEKKTDVQECGVFVTYYDSGGYIIGAQYISSDQPTFADCQKFQNAVKFILAISGFWVTG